MSGSHTNSIQIEKRIPTESTRSRIDSHIVIERVKVEVVTLCVFEVLAFCCYNLFVKISSQHWCSLVELERHVTFALVFLSVSVADFDVTV